MPRRGGEEAGLTLVELAAALALLALASSALVASRFSALELERRSHDAALAMRDLRAVMEEILVLPQERVPLEYPPGEAIPLRRGRSLAGESIVPSYPGFAGGDVPNPLEIVLTATWDDFEGRARSLSLASLKAR